MHLLNLNLVIIPYGGPFVILGWIASCCTEAQVFWIRELGLGQLQLTLVRLVPKLSPVCRNFGHMPMAGETVTKELWQTHNMTIKAIRFVLDKINKEFLSKVGKVRYKKHVISEIAKARKEIISINSEIKRKKLVCRIQLCYKTNTKEGTTSSMWITS